jgi:hypothetical protein
LLLTPSDDFNTLGAAELRDELGQGHVYRIAPQQHVPDLLPPSREAGILGTPSLTFVVLDRQFAAGARMVSRNADQAFRLEGEATELPLFAVTHDGKLSVAADGRPLDVRAGDTVIGLVIGSVETVGSEGLPVTAGPQ